MGQRKKKKNHPGPTRVRQHEIDDLADADFQKRIAQAGWIPRAQDRNDYGIDREVEIVVDGQVTGIIFKAQLKGTDQASLKKALSVRLKSEVRELYRNMKIPVLVVRYHVPSGRMFVRFFHSHAPEASWSKDSKGTLRMSEEDEWTDLTPTLIDDMVRDFHDLRGSGLSRPIRLQIAGAERVAGISKSAVELQIREDLDGSLADIATASGPTGIHGTIRLKNSGLTVDLATVASSSVTYGDHARTSIQVASDALVMLAITLARLGKSDLAARLLRVHASRSSVIDDPEIGVRVFAALLSAREIEQALVLEDDLSGRPGSPGGFVAIELLQHAEQLSDGDKALVERYFEDLSASLDSKSDPRSAAAAFRNLGVARRARGRGGEALAALREAARLHPGNLDDPGFQSMLGGSSYLDGDLDGAVNAYRRAISLGASGPERALLADSLMALGQYRDAAKEMASYLDKADNPDSEWVLKEAVLRVICERVGNAQSRDPNLADTLVPAEDEEPGAADADQLEAALKADALCARAWYEEAVGEAKKGHHDHAFTPFLVACVLDPHRCGNWVYAIVSGAIAEADQEIFYRAVILGYRHCKAHLLDHVESQMEDVPELRDATVQMIADIIRVEEEGSAGEPDNVET